MGSCGLCGPGRGGEGKREGATGLLGGLHAGCPQGLAELLATRC